MTVLEKLDRMILRFDNGGCTCDRSANYECELCRIFDVMVDAIKEIQRLRKALGKYADHEEWAYDGLYCDGWEIAEEALRDDV